MYLTKDLGKRIIHCIIERECGIPQLLLPCESLDLSSAVRVQIAACVKVFVNTSLDVHMTGVRVVAVGLSATSFAINCRSQFCFDFVSFSLVHVN